jgi:hypothetical protein
MVYRQGKQSLILIAALVLGKRRPHGAFFHALSACTNKKASQGLRGFFMDQMDQAIYSGGEGGIRTRGGD